MSRRTGAAGRDRHRRGGDRTARRGRRHRRRGDHRRDGAARRHPAHDQPEDERILAVDLASGEVVLAASDETRMRGQVRLLVRPRVRARAARRRRRRGRPVRAPPTRLGRLRPPRARRPRTHQRLVPPGAVGARPRVRERRRRDAARPGAGLGRSGRDPVDPVGHPGARPRRRSARRACAPCDPAREAGWNTLLISYRNDGEAPESDDGRYGLGGTRVGRRRGRRPLRGGPRRRAHRAHGLVDGRRDRAAGRAARGGRPRAARGRHPRLARRRLGATSSIPGPGARTAERTRRRGRATPRRTVERWPHRPGGADRRRGPRPRRAAPTSSTCRSCSCTATTTDSCRSTARVALAAARPDLVEFEAFEGARHTKLWNHDPERWTALVRGWLERSAVDVHRLGDEAEIAG